MNLNNFPNYWKRKTKIIAKIITTVNIRIKFGNFNYFEYKKIMVIQNFIFRRFLNPEIDIWNYYIQKIFFNLEDFTIL